MKDNGIKGTKKEQVFYQIQLYGLEPEFPLLKFLQELILLHLVLQREFLQF